MLPHVSIYAYFYSDGMLACAVFKKSSRVWPKILFFFR